MRLFGVADDGRSLRVADILGSAYALFPDRETGHFSSFGKGFMHGIDHV